MYQRESLDLYPFLGSLNSVNLDLLPVWYVQVSKQADYSYIGGVQYTAEFQSDK